METNVHIRSNISLTLESVECLHPSQVQGSFLTKKDKKIVKSKPRKKRHKRIGISCKLFGMTSHISSADMNRHAKKLPTSRKPTNFTAKFVGFRLEIS